MFCEAGLGTFKEAQNTNWISLNMLIADKVSTEVDSKEKDKPDSPLSQEDEISALTSIIPN